MKRDELRGLLLDHALRHGLTASEAEWMTDETLKRFSRLVEKDLPGTSKLFSEEELGQLLREAFEDILGQNR